MILVGSNHRQTEKNLRRQRPTHRRKWRPSGAHDPDESCVPPSCPVPRRRWRAIARGLGTSHVYHARRGFSVVVQVCSAALVRGSVAPWCGRPDRSLTAPLRVLPL